MGYAGFIHARIETALLSSLSHPYLLKGGLGWNRGAGLQEVECLCGYANSLAERRRRTPSSLSSAG